MKQKQMPTYYFVDLFTDGNYAVAEAEDAVLPAPRRGSGMSATRRCCADALLPTHWRAALPYSVWRVRGCSMTDSGHLTNSQALE